MPEKIQVKRHSGFELLRIVSMAMIVLMHAIGHGGLGDSVKTGSLDYHVYWTLYGFSRVSTNCFVMLTGYYMARSKFRPSRLVRIWCEVLVYSVVTYAVAVKLGVCELSMFETVKTLTPIISGAYWFATAYVLLYLCVPILNRAISAIESKRTFRRLLCVMIIATSVLPTVFYWADPAYINGGYGYIWFIVLYFISAYIGLYDVRFSTKKCLAVYTVLALTVSTTRMLAEIATAKIGSTTLVDNVLDYKSPVVLVMSVAFFLAFKNLSIKNSTVCKAVLAIAPLSFGVYLVHDGDRLREILWKTVRVDRFSGLLQTIGYVFAVCVAIIAVGYCTSFVVRFALNCGLFKKLESKIENLFGGNTRE